MKPLHIVVYMMYWYPYEGALQPIYGRIIKELIAKGHQVTIVSSRPHRRTGMNRDWKEYRGKLFHQTEWEGATHYMTWVFAPYFERGIGMYISRILSYLTFHLSSFWIVLRKIESPDVLFLPTSPPVSNGIVGRWLSRLKRIPFVYNVQDMYPQVAVGKGLIRKGGMLEKLVQRIENRTYLKSAKTILLADAMRDIVEKELGLPSEKFTVIPNFVDDSRIRPEAKHNPFSQKYGLQERFVILYAGNLGEAHDYRSIIEAAEQLQAKQEILFLFVSRGTNIPHAKELAKSKQLTNVMFLDYQPEELVSKMYASADASLVTLNPAHAKTVIPSKTYSIMASKRPVLGVMPIENPMANVVERADCGLLIQPGDDKGLADAIVKLYSNNELKRTLGENGRDYLVEHFSPATIIAQYEQLFEEVSRYSNA